MSRTLSAEAAPHHVGFVSSLDELTGTSGDDILVGTNGQDTINGLDGDDDLSGAGGADAIEGGSGDDVVSGGSGADQLSGSDGDDRLAGGSGNDQLDGGGDIDRLLGGSGDDTLIGGANGDHLDGGSGFDFASYATSQTALHLGYYTAGADDGTGDVYDEIEGVIGSAFDDTIKIDGLMVINGGAGADTIAIGSGSHTTIIGGAGADTLSGASATFDYQNLSDSTKAAPDQIVRFTPNNMIDVSAIDADSTMAGNQAFTIVDALDGHAGELSINYNLHHHVFTVSLDVNGDAKADMKILVEMANPGDVHDSSFVL